MSKPTQPSTLTLSLDFNRTWRTLKEDRSLKATIFYHIVKIGGFTDYDHLQSRFPVTVDVNRTENQVEIQFSSLRALGIFEEQFSCPADLDRELRKKALLLADPETRENKMLALNMILGTCVGGIDTAPPHHCQS